MDSEYAMASARGHAEGFIIIDDEPLKPLETQLLTDLEGGKTPEKLLKELSRFPTFVSYFLISIFGFLSPLLLLVTYSDWEKWISECLISLFCLLIGVGMKIQISNNKKKLLRIKQGEDPNLIFKI